MSAGDVVAAKPSRSTAKSVALWVVSGLLAGVFLLSGGMKFANPDMAKQFVQWGYPAWFHLLIGAVEIVAGLALLVPRSAFYAAAALAVVMVGAASTHLLHAELPQAVVPIVIFALLLAVAYVRRPRWA